MASVTRSKDHSIWLKHVKDASGETLKHLNDMAAEQDVVLRLGSQEGTWTRFRSLPSGSKSTGFKCNDENAKRIWNNILIGESVSLDVVCVIPETDNQVVLRKSPDASIRRPQNEEHFPELEALGVRQEGTVLGIGVDVAWWGGSRKSKDSRAEAIAFSVRRRGEWNDLKIEQIDLNPLFNENADAWTPNADADATLLATALERVISQHTDLDRIAIALDVPILAQNRGLAPAKKANAKGERGGVPRQCDRAWITARSSSPVGWAGVKILPGAPTVPRCDALLKKLREQGFEVFGLCEADHNRQLIECFPNEIVWSIGALGIDTILRPDSFQQYKRLGKKNLPLARDLFHASWRRTVQRSMEIAGASSALVKCWTGQFEAWLESSACFNIEHQIGFTGKSFDDAVESVLSLTAAMAFADGTAHIHRGTDPEDGHIIGPGLRCPE